MSRNPLEEVLSWCFSIPVAVLVLYWLFKWLFEYFLDVLDLVREARSLKKANAKNIVRGRAMYAETEAAKKARAQERKISEKEKEVARLRAKLREVERENE